MIKIFIFLVLLLNITFADNLYKELKEKKMFEDFNVEEFERNSKNGEDYFFIDKDEININQFIGFNSFVEEKTYPNPSFLYEYISYYINGKIKYYLLQLKNDGYKIVEKYFDEKGDIEKTINYDNLYKIQLDEVLNIFKKEFPLVDEYETVINRYEISNLKDLYNQELYVKKFIKKYSFFENDINKLKFPMKIYEIKFYTKNETEITEDNEAYEYEDDENIFIINDNLINPLLHVKRNPIPLFMLEEKENYPTIFNYDFSYDTSKLKSLAEQEAEN